jgi:hypothetical protein
MNTIDYFRIQQQQLHDSLRFAVKDLTTDEWHYRLPGTGNHIAFLLWHIVSTEDGALRFLLQGRSPLWQEGHWREQLGLPPRGQGTGMPSEDAHALRINDTALFLDYAEQVWREFEDYLASITDGGMSLSKRTVTVTARGKQMPALLMIGEVCLSHLFIHLGEIALLRGVLGKQELSF